MPFPQGASGGLGSRCLNWLSWFKLTLSASRYPNGVFISTAASDGAGSKGVNDSNSVLQCQVAENLSSLDDVLIKKLGARVWAMSEVRCLGDLSASKRSPVCVIGTCDDDHTLTVAPFPSNQYSSIPPSYNMELDSSCMLWKYDSMGNCIHCPEFDTKEACRSRVAARALFNSSQRIPLNHTSGSFDGSDATATLNGSCTSDSNRQMYRRRMARKTTSNSVELFNLPHVRRSLSPSRHSLNRADVRQELSISPPCSGADFAILERKSLSNDGRESTCSGFTFSEKEWDSEDFDNYLQIKS